MTTSAQLLPLLAVLAFRGADAATFLNGQLSINAAALPPARWQRAAYCSRQGRMLANGILVHVAEAPAADAHFALLLRADIAEQTAALLKKFILRAKVQIDAPVAGVFCTAADAPALPGGAAETQDGITKVDEGGGRALLFCTEAQALAQMHARCGDGDDGCAGWQRQEILRGVPWICAATQDSFIPQFVNFDLLGGVDFNKGCFVGQEVIARLHHLGDVKRRGMIVRGSGAANAADALHTAAGKPAGEVANAAADAAPAGGFVAFAALAKAAAAEEVRLDGASVQVLPPPYPIVEQEKFKRR